MPRPSGDSDDTGGDREPPEQRPLDDGQSDNLNEPTASGGADQNGVAGSSGNDKLLITGETSDQVRLLQSEADSEAMAFGGVVCTGGSRTIVDVDTIAPRGDGSVESPIGVIDTALEEMDPVTYAEERSLPLGATIVVPGPTANTAFQLDEGEDGIQVVSELSVVTTASSNSPGRAGDGETPSEPNTTPSNHEPSEAAGRNVRPGPSDDSGEATQPETGVDIGREVAALQTMFNDISRDDLYRLSNGSIGAAVTVVPSSEAVDSLELLIEYTDAFPQYPPRVWIQQPQLTTEYGSIVEVDSHGDARIQYIDPHVWARHRDTRVALDHLRSWIVHFCQQQEQQSPGEIVRETTEYVAERGQDLFNGLRARSDVEPEESDRTDAAQDESDGGPQNRRG